MIHTIKYSLLPGFERTGVLAPILPVTFFNGKYEMASFALVDSGAEYGLVSTVIAEALHIDWTKLPQKRGFTTSGSFAYRTAKNIYAEIFDQNFRLNLNIAEGVNAFKCILGRNDIFKQAKITFEGYRNQFIIEFRNLN